MNPLHLRNLGEKTSFLWSIDYSLTKSIFEDLLQSTLSIKITEEIHFYVWITIISRA